MKVAKIVGGGCLGLIVFVGLIIGVVFYATSGITDTADEFFAATSEGDYDKAYSLTTVQFQQAVSRDRLKAIAEQNGWDQVTDTSWGSRSISNNIGEIEGTLTTRDGREIPITIELLSVNDEWKITLLSTDDAGIRGAGGMAGGATSSSVPPPAEQARLVHEVTLTFHRALAEPDLSSFHALWADDITLEILESNFANFRQFHGEMEALTDAEPDFVPATEMWREGLWQVSGTYDTPDGTLDFKYIFDVTGPRELLLAGMDANWK